MNIFRVTLSGSRRHLLTWLTVGGAGMVVLAIFFSVVPTNGYAHDAVSLAPEQIGIGQGVAACISSAPTVGCNTAGDTVYTVTYDESMHTSGSVYAGIVVAASPHDFSLGDPLERYVPAKDTQTFIFPYGYTPSRSGFTPQAHNAYSLEISPNQDAFQNQGYWYDKVQLPDPPGCTPAQTWTSYCTGGSDPNGNNWQWWEHDNSSPTQYRYLRPGDGTCVPPTTPPSSPPATVSHSCSASGTPVTLSWSSVPTATTYAVSIYLLPNTASCPATWSDNGIVNGTHACQGNTPATSITFSMPPGTNINSYIYAGNTAGYSSPSTAQNFTCSPPPTATLSASPPTVVSGNKTTLTWSSTNATSCSAAGGFDTGGRTSGSALSIPLTTNPADFQVTCTGPGGVGRANTSVTVTSPTVAISATPTRVTSGSSTTVSWKATDVDTCDITRNGSHWKTLPTDAPLTSSSPDTITGQTVYEITCTDASTKAHADSVVVNTGTGGFQEF